MDEVEVIRKRKVPGGGERTEDCAVWVDGRTLGWCRTDASGTDEGEREFLTAEAAEQAARVLIEQLKEEGFALREPVAEPAESPSQPKEGSVEPDWFRNLTDEMIGQRAELRKVAAAIGLGHRIDEIETLMRPGIALSLRVAEGEELDGVVSRVGGEPDLPPGQPWPTYEGAPLTFVGQVVISAGLKRLDLEGLLPEQGVLSFFAQLDFEAAQYGEQGVVLYLPTIEELVRTGPPSPKYVHNTAGVLFAPRGMLEAAPIESQGVEDLELNGDEYDDYNDEFYVGSGPQDGPSLLLLGWSGTAYDSEGMRFVAQFPSDSRIDFEMGDCQPLRFYIEGDVVNAETLKTAVCTLSEA